MRPIFTIHAGEYLVGAHLEKLSKNLRVWIPSKDTGIDLLVTDQHSKKLATLQVKFSKDYFGSQKGSESKLNIDSFGWWKFDRAKLESSPADYWVLVLYQFHTREFDFVVVSPKVLLSRYDKLTDSAETIQSYFCVTKQRQCWEARGLGASELERISEGNYHDKSRSFTKYLNTWPFHPYT